MNQKTNIVIILNDDMGYSDLGCYGGEIATPNLDRLANNGVRLTQFYNTARCTPSRASLLTGLHPHQTGIGILTENLAPEGYAGNLNERCITIAEALKPHGYRTYLSGKWHLTNDVFREKHTWPLQRGFDRFYGTITGAGSFFDPATLTRDNGNIEHEAQADPDFYYTDAIGDNAVSFIQDHQQGTSDRPFFLYVAYTAPHWPLHALEEDTQKYKGRFDDGWDALREERMKRMIDMGLLEPSWPLSERDPSQPAWSDAEHKAWWARCMEVYAAQIDRMDRGIGKLVQSLEETGQLDNTLLLFLSDNGGCAEVLEPKMESLFVDTLKIANTRTRAGEKVKFGNVPSVMPGPENTYQSYGVAWANLSNTPFRLYKHWVHEGGIATPLIVHWPGEIAEGGALRHTPCQLPDIMATVLDATGAEYPTTYHGHSIREMEGKSLLPVLENDHLEPRSLFWEHEGNAAVRQGRWKLVRKYPGDWELYDMRGDRTETANVAAQHPDIVASLSREYDGWAERCGVLPREYVIELLQATLRRST